MDKKIKTYCSYCDNETNQVIIFDDSSFNTKGIMPINDKADNPKPFWVIEANIWKLSKCLGCDRINFKHTSRTNPDGTNDIITYFPKRLFRRMPIWISQLPLKYFDILKEVYLSINEELLILALMGIRTVLDIFIVDKVGDKGAFKSKLQELVKLGVISNSKLETLEVVIDAGSAAAHRGFKPDMIMVHKVLDIVENLLQSEVVDKNKEVIKNNTPKINKPQLGRA